MPSVNKWGLGAHVCGNNKESRQHGFASIAITASGYDRPRNMRPYTRSRRTRVDERVAVGTCTWNAQRGAVADLTGLLAAGCSIWSARGA